MIKFLKITVAYAVYSVHNHVESAVSTLIFDIHLWERLIFHILATSVAERVAQERGERQPGDSVGYHIRLSAQLPRKHGSILFCTTGMLLKYIEKYLNFEHFSHIILDEIHERNIEMDFLLIFIRRLLTIRPDIKVILMR